MKLSKSKTELGALIDMSERKFKKTLKKQNYNLGMYNTLQNMLASAYKEVTGMKDECIDLYCKQVNDKSVPKKDCKSTLRNIKKLYVQLARIEQKYILLKKIREGLMKQAETAFDDKKNV